MSRLNQRIKALVPNGVRRALAHALRPVGAPRRVRSFLSFDGSFTLPTENGDLTLEYANRWIERDLFWHGWKGYEPVSVDLWRRAAANARTIVDIGANSGLFALAAAKTNSHARVIAFEPLPVFADALERNATLNKLSVELVRAAVSNEEGRAQFYVPEEWAGNVYSSSLSREHYERHQKSAARVLDVDVVTLDAVADRMLLRNVDLVKVDAEGHDVMVLEGMQELIARDLPDFLIEIQDDAAGERMMRLLPPGRYAYFNVSETTGARREARLGRSDTVNWLVCKPGTARRLGLGG